MTGKPEVLFRNNSGRKKVSVILTDWNVRESFHSLEYLNRQSAPRDDYELIWVEFYDRKPEQIQRMVGSSGRPMLDQWIVLGYPPELLYHKHRDYNAGILAANGDICVICDSDAMFRPTFIENVIGAFHETAYAAVHIDVVRNLDQRFYPFNYPSFEEVMGPGCVNWNGTSTQGLWSEEDRLHRASYGACLAARRSDLLAIGCADEHVDYLGCSSGPYELSFRLINRGRRERWLTNEYLYQTWHPNQTSINRDYSGPHDGRHLSLRALHARASGQIHPFLENPCIQSGSNSDRFTEFLRFVAEHPESTWRADNPPASLPDFAYRVENDYRGYDLFVYHEEWFAQQVASGFDAAQTDILWAPDEESIRSEIASRSSNRAGSHPPGHVQRFVRNLLAEPLHTLPRRAWRIAERVLKNR